MPDPCDHPIGGLRQCETYPEKYVTCLGCGELFLIDRLVDFYKPDGLSVAVLWTCLSGNRMQDLRPLASVLAAGTTLDYVQGKDRTATEPMSEEDPKWQPKRS